MRNEALDTSVYALAAAHLVGLSRIQWRDEEKEIILEESTIETPSQPTGKTRIQRTARRKANGIKVY